MQYSSVKIFPIFPTFLLVAIAGCRTPSLQATPPASSPQHVEEIVSRLEGAMDTSAQAQAMKEAPNVRITNCQVTVKDAETTAGTPVTYLYQEQAMSNKLAQPYRQRFLRIAPSADQTSVESAIFRPPTPKNWIGLCNKPVNERLIQTQDLGKSECSVYLKPAGEDYLGETQAGGCPSNHKGAVKITNKILLFANGMDTWDRGFDANGQLVWGAKETPYQFRRLK